MFTVASYDLPDDKRRLQVMQTLQDFGTRVQYSVFECDLTASELGRLRERLMTIIEPAEDDVRFYFLCEECVPRMRRLGRPRQSTRRPDFIIT